MLANVRLDFVMLKWLNVKTNANRHGTVITFPYTARSVHFNIKHKHVFSLLFSSYYLPLWYNRVFTETLRKYPILPLLDRISSSDYQLPAANGTGTVTLPAGTNVYIPVLALHHDPTYFPEPEKFDPDRFTEENKRSRPNYTYIPFGEGQRLCIGKDRLLVALCISFGFRSSYGIKLI
jgi:cytochrome P450